MRFVPKERLQRVLGLGDGPGLPRPARMLLLLAALALVAVVVALLDPRPTLRHVKVTVLSGGASGNYHATVDKIAAEVARRRGAVRNIATAGSVENVRRLVDGRGRCDAHFALVQDGVDWPAGHGLELVGRLPRMETLLLLGARADGFRTIDDLRGLRVGIGPVGSGTEHLMRKVLAPLAPLRLDVTTPSIDAQLDLLARGELDLGAMVIDEDAALVAEAVRARNLQVLSLPEAAALARALPFAHAGTLAPGQFDYVRRLPPEPKQVLRVQTLVVGNGCASHAQTQGLMSAIAEVFPTFVRHNRGEPNFTGLPLATVARSFFDEEGPDLVGQHAPWVVDIMPTATWVKLFVGFSVLFTAMGLGHRYRLWRVDASRVRLEREIPEIFGNGTTVGDILAMPVRDAHRAGDVAARLASIDARLVALAERCRRQSLSVLVPMGEEMAYRYQETLIADTLHALRAYRERVDRALPPAPSPETGRLTSARP